MPKTINEEGMRWIMPIINKEMRLVDVAKVCPYSERSLKRWKKEYILHGENGLIPQSTKPRSHPNETPIRVKEKVIELRKETNLCAKKLHYKLKKEGIEINDRIIGRIIKNEGLTRGYRTKKSKDEIC